MRFIFHHDAGNERVEAIDGALTHIKALRLKTGGRLSLRNMRDNFLYIYLIENIEKRFALLRLFDKKEYAVQSREISLAWCVVDDKIIEKTLPFLNELGVKKLTFVASGRSQRNFRVDYRRAERIIISSCEQCGRSEKMELAEETLSGFISKCECPAVMDPYAETSAANAGSAEFIVGPEGGFCEEDYKLLENVPRFSIPANTILRSETAIICAASIALINAI